MVRMPWATYLWPGLPQLWYGGLSSGLLLAVGFAVLANALLLATFVWVELFSPRFLQIAWLATGVLWIGSAALSAWFAPQARNRATSDAIFREALHEYLKENWFEAQRVLGRLLQAKPSDVEARLMLATLMRHTGRHQEALEQLARVELLADAGRWAAEISAEKRWIADARKEPPTPETSSTIDIPSPTASPRAA